MKYHIIATVDNSKFLSEVVHADNKDDAEIFAKHYISSVYIGEVNIIRVVEEIEWQKLMAEIRKK